MKPLKTMFSLGSSLVGWSTLLAQVILLHALITASDALSCADGYACGVVRPTPDGFLALRIQPKTSSDQIVMLKPFEIVVFATSDCAPHRDTDLWREIACVPRIDGICGSANRRLTRGWAAARYIETTPCPVDLNSLW